MPFKLCIGQFVCRSASVSVSLCVGQFVCWSVLCHLSCALVSLCVGQFVCRSVCVLVSLFVGQFVCWSICVLVSLHVGQFVCWSVCVLVSLHVGQCVCVCVSVSLYQLVCVGQCPISVSTVDEADLSPQVTEVHVLVTQDSTDTQTACPESVEPLLASPDTADVIKQTRFMFVMDGTQLRLLQEDEDPLVVSDTP